MTPEYYKIGISGHRDLLPSQKKANLLKLEDHLRRLQLIHNEKKMLVLTALSVGADRLIAQVAVDLKISFDVILPMPINLYIKDFSPQFQKEFFYYLEQARSIQIINFYAANTPDLVTRLSMYRNFQYRQAGRVIVDLSDEIIIMSNGKDNKKMGGTSDISEYAKFCGKIIFKIRCDRISA